MTPLAYIKKYLSIIIAFAVIVIIIVPYIFLFYYMQKNKKKLSIYPEFKILEIKNGEEDLSGLGDAIRIGQEIYNKISGGKK